MDYNGNQVSLTRCQISTMHKAILEDDRSIRNVLTPSTIISPNNPAISGNTCIPNTGSLYTLTNYHLGTESSWSVSPSSVVTTSSGCGFPAQLTPSGSQGTATLSFTSDWGTNGTRSANKSINVNPQITGTIYYPSASQPLEPMNYVLSNQIDVNVNAPGISSFSWTKTAGSGSWSTYNSGAGNNINITPSSSISFLISPGIPACPIARQVTFIPTTGFFSLFPNPVESELTVTSTTAYEIKYPKSVSTSQAPPKGTEKTTHFDTQTLTIDPSIEQVKLYDIEGNTLKNLRTNRKSKEEKLNVSDLRPGTYIVELLNGDTHIPTKARTVKTKLVKQ